jgi:hypothetical protein
MAHSLGRTLRFQKRERIHSWLRRQHLDAFEVVQCLQCAKQRLQRRATACFEILQRRSRDSRFLGNSSLVDIAGQTQLSHSAAQLDLQFLWRLKLHITHSH